MNTKNILIVGGAGFIGSQVNKMLHQKGWNTIVFDNLSLGSREAVTCGTFIQGDMANTQDLKDLFSKYKFDAVMHFAALIDVGESCVQPGKYYANNVVNTLNLLEAMREHSVRHFIFSSSAAIYGLPIQDRITESHPCNPINPYGETKLMVEKILRDYGKAYGITSCCLRYFNAAGGDPEGEIKNFKKKESNLIPILLKSLKQKEGALSIFGTDYPTPDGTCIRDYIHVYDLGMAHITALEHLLSGAPSSFYNLGNGSGFSVQQVIQTAELVTGLKARIIIAPRRPGDSPILVADSSKARKELHWQPRYFRLEDMITHAWNALK